MLGEDLLAEGEPVPTKITYREWERLSPSEPLLGFFQVGVPLSEGWSRIEIPFSFRAWSDPMPEGIVHRLDDLGVTLRHDPGGPPPAIESREIRPGGSR